MLPPGCVGWTVLPPIMVGGDVQRPHVRTVGFQEIWSRRFAFAVRSGGTAPKHSPVKCGGEWSRRFAFAISLRRCERWRREPTPPL
jgi:hypothetical protein